MVEIGDDGQRNDGGNSKKTRYKERSKELCGNDTKNGNARKLLQKCCEDWTDAIYYQGPLQI